MCVCVCHGLATECLPWNHGLLRGALARHRRSRIATECGIHGWPFFEVNAWGQGASFSRASCGDTSLDSLIVTVCVSVTHGSPAEPLSCKKNWIFAIFGNHFLVQNLTPMRPVAIVLHAPSCSTFESSGASATQGSRRRRHAVNMIPPHNKLQELVSRHPAVAGFDCQEHRVQTCYNMSLLQAVPIVIHRVGLPLLPLPLPTPSPVHWPPGVWISYGDVCNDVKISHCRLVRVRFVFGKRWGGVPLRCALTTSIGGLIWSCNPHAKGIFEISFSWLFYRNPTLLFYLKIFGIVCSELLKCVCLGVWGFCTCWASLGTYQFWNLTSATFR